MRSNLAIFLVVVLGLATSCSTLDLVSGVHRSVQPISDAAKTFTVLKQIDGYGRFPPSRSVRLPTGVYTLEAEDGEYWYFRAPVPIEVNLLEENPKYHRYSRYALPGGIMLSKRFNAVPAAAYLDVSATGKRMVLEFGPDFRTLEGGYWKQGL